MLDRLLSMLIDFKAREEGQAMVEYALVLGFVVAIAAIALATVGPGLGASLDAALDAVGLEL